MTLVNKGSPFDLAGDKVEYKVGDKVEIIKDESSQEPTKGKWDDFVVGAKVRVLKHDYSGITFPDPTVITEVHWEDDGQKCMSVKSDADEFFWSVVLGSSRYSLELVTEDTPETSCTLTGDTMTKGKYLIIGKDNCITTAPIEAPIAIVHNGYTLSIKGQTIALTYQELIDLYSSVEDQLYG